MDIISQRQMRNDSASILRRVEAGESFVITNRGVEVARLVPFRAPNNPERDELVNRGVLVARRVGHVDLPVLVETDVDVEAALEDLRSER